MFLLRFVKKIVANIIRIVYRYTYNLISIDDKVIIFISFHGRGYSDNPRAIYEQMRQDARFKDYKFIWFIKNHKQKNIEIPGAEVKEYFSLPYFYYMSKAKYWIINCKLPTYICKKPDQIYLQTWHGTPLKRLGHDIIASDNATFYRSAMSFESMCQSYDIDVARYNYMISPNKFCTEVFQTSFGINRERLIETGYPRNDFITNATADDVKSLKDKFHLPMDKKIILYAPTWRDDQFYEAGQYGFELDLDVNRLQEEFGDEYVLLLRLHYFIVDQLDLSKYGDFTVDGSSYDDITDLYLISDMLITDYSSVFFDYANLKRPVLYYTYDLDKYRDVLRGFYLDMEKDLPGPLLLTNDEVVDAIKNIDKIKEQYKDRYEEFYNRFCCVDDGHAAQRVVEKVFK